MRKSDLYYEADASGFLLYYKHRCIGGYPAKVKGSPGQIGKKQKAHHEYLAELEIKLILEGRGHAQYHERIRDIDESFERYRRK